MRKPVPSQFAVLLGLPLLVCAFHTRAAAQDDPLLSLPPYRPVEKLSGTLVISGSNTVADVAAVWQDQFVKLYPDVKVTLRAKGSATAITDLKSGEAHLGMSSSAISEKQLPKAMQFVVSTDLLAVYVHEDNPIKQLTLAQLDAVFSKDRKRGEKAIAKWSDLGVAAELGEKPIKVIGRNSDSGTNAFFKATVLQSGDYKADVAAKASNSESVSEVAKDSAAIAYAGMAFQRPGVRALAIAEDDDADAAAPSLDKPSSPYLLRRPLLLVTVGKPTGIPAEFIKYALSRQGQQDAVLAGVVPLSSAVLRQQLEKSGVEIVR